MALAVGVWNYTLHPMRMADTILPGHTSPGAIKGSTIHARSFLFLLASSKVRPTDTRDNISLSFTQDYSNSRERDFFILREHISTLVPLLPLGDHFLVNYFSLLNQMDPRSNWLSTKFPHSHLQLSSYLHPLTTQEKTSSQAVIKLQNWKPSISTPSLFVFFLLI